MKKILLIIGLCVPLVVSAQTRKFSEIVTDGDTITSAASTDFLYVIEDPLGTPASKAVRASAFATHQDISDSIAGLAGGHDAVTLAGSYDYITLTDQVITRGQVDLTTDVTGTLPDANVANDITISNISQVGDITASAAEINTPLDGASVTLTEFQELETIGATTISANQWAALGGIAETLTSTELNTLDGVPGTLTATELGYVDGVTSAIQTQLDGKLATANLSPAASDLWFTSDTIPNTPYQIDTSLMVVGYPYMLFDNTYGSDSIVIRAMNILVSGTTAPDVTIDISWNATGAISSGTDLNTTPLNITSTGITADLTFDNNVVPKGQIVMMTFTDVTTKPDYSIVVTLFYSRQNRAY